ncbi:Mak11 protein [Martiniozyma asiatica (nom. inval.)]|nr:Mak11 protein [Martiniozyma asiatica]
MTSFRIIVGSYEHSLLCLSLTLTPTPHFHPIFHFQAHSLSVKCIDLADRYLVTGSNDEHIRIYDLQKRKELGTLLQHQGSITSLCFSNEPKESNYPLHKHAHHLLSTSTDGKILLWRTKDWELLKEMKGHRGAILCLSIHPSNRVAISCGEDNTIRLWNLMTGKKASGLKIKGAWSRGQKAEFVKFSPDGEYFVVGLRDRLFIWKTREGKLTNIYMTNKMTLMCIDFITLDKKDYLVVGLSNGAINFYHFDQSENLLTPQENITGSPEETPQLPKAEFELHGHGNRVKGFSVFKSNDETYLTSISSDGKIVVWDLTTGSKNFKDQIAVYDSGERLNVIATVEEEIEKASTMKPIYNPDDFGYGTESEYESDAEGLKEIMEGRRKNKQSKKAKKKAKAKLLSVEIEK